VQDLPHLTIVSGVSDAKLQELNAYRASRKLPAVSSSGSISISRAVRPAASSPEPK
jgi:hypothetical protein